MGVKERLGRYFDEDIAGNAFLEFELLVLAIAAGINDATTFVEYKIFVSNQTGNTALLAVGALGLGAESSSLPNIGVALSLFVLGGMVFGQVGDHVGRKRRFWLVLSNFMQTVLFFIATALRHWYDRGHNLRSLSVVALLSFASGGQVALARTINVPEITTAMVTSAYIDFVVDPRILKHHNRQRNRRILFVICLLVGSFIGAITHRHAGPSLAFLLSSILKTFVTAAFFFNPAGVLVEKEASRTVETAQPV